MWRRKSQQFLSKNLDMDELAEIRDYLEKKSITQQKLPLSMNQLFFYYPVTSCDRTEFTYRITTYYADEQKTKIDHWEHLSLLSYGVLSNNDAFS